MLPLSAPAEGDEEALRLFEGQILPSADSDGFFYALLKKTSG
jgi:hypothetical protein